jgi:hypothetical protein
MYVSVDNMVIDWLTGKDKSLGTIFSLELKFKDFDGFSRWIENFSPSSHIRLEPWLSSLALPPLTQLLGGGPERPTDRDRREAGVVGEELKKLLKKLTKDFSVEKLWKLTVSDDEHFSISDSLIASYVNDLQVEELYWKKPNLDIDVLLSQPHGAKSLRVISLFSSTIGSLMYWVGEEGVVRFPNVRAYLIVHVFGEADLT